MNEVVITTTDFSFRGPDTIPAGLTRFRLFNQGSERHHAQLARLEDGRTIGELRDSFTAGGDLPSWVTFVGGPNEQGDIFWSSISGLVRRTRAITTEATMPLTRLPSQPACK